MNVERNEADHQFEVEVEGHTGLLSYRQHGQTLALTHTEVPGALQGKGIGQVLAKGALDYAREHHLVVQPYCSFVAGYLKKHPEYKDLIEPGFPTGD